MIQRLQPTRLIPLVLVGYLANLLLGPFVYEYYSYYAVGYLALCFSVLWVGSLLAEGVGPTVVQPSQAPNYQITPRYERLLQLGMGITIVATGLLGYYLLVVSGVSYDEGLGMVRRTLSMRHFTEADIADPFWSKLVEAVSTGGLAFYLLLAAVSKLQWRWSIHLAFACVIGPAAATILQGGRGGAISAALFIITTGLVRRGMGQRFLPMVGGTPVAIVPVVVVAYYTLQIFVLRAQVSGSEMIDLTEVSLVVPGDVALRPTYRSIDSALGGALAPLYMLSYYFSHSLSFFSRVFDLMDYSHIYYGGLLFRLVGFIVRPLGVPFPAYLDITYSQVYHGRYPTFAQGFLLDWGLMGTPVAVGLAGFWWGRAWRSYAAGAFWARVIYPTVITMIIASPIYYFPHWGGMDFALAGILVFWLIVRRGIMRVPASGSS